MLIPIVILIILPKHPIIKFDKFLMSEMGVKKMKL